METPALIFDEVDVGISGPTAAVVGKLLRQLGESTQVMCVTSPAAGRRMWSSPLYRQQETDGEMTETHMKPLDKRSRLQELAVCCSAAVKSRAIPSRMRKNCWRHKLFFSGSQGHTEQQKRRQTGFKVGRRSIIIGILHMSRVLLGPKKESNHYAL